jgi:hypothetical protein
MIPRSDEGRRQFPRPLLRPAIPVLTLAKTAFNRHLDADGKVILREVLLNDALTMSAQSGLSIACHRALGIRRWHEKDEPLKDKLRLR